eukprot:CAMPEP_0170173214 /NCGR_PEP_ID=MMETSP0040_2-20121228/6489_1 /TAXON_ID=641309 /ORGANISM="Lotharella oceanica, Strain CCMP622" /LENGTH=215 /DNA_ID=CAMNT_0010414293 /DNA_START=499 /DNA_END=1147 /DNA_ORIENTATION=-
MLCCYRSKKKLPKKNIDNPIGGDDAELFGPETSVDPVTRSTAKKVTKPDKKAVDETPMAEEADTKLSKEELEDIISSVQKAEREMSNDNENDKSSRSSGKRLESGIMERMNSKTSGNIVKALDKISESDFKMTKDVICAHKQVSRGGTHVVYLRLINGDLYYADNPKKLSDAKELEKIKLSLDKPKLVGKLRSKNKVPSSFRAGVLQPVFMCAHA